MKGYLLIIGTLIVIISALITLNIFFQQSLQMEVAEQFNKHQLLLSTSTANNIKSYFYFLKEEIVELARELPEKGIENKTAFDVLIANELKHKRLIKTNVGILDAGEISFYRGDKALIKQLAPQAVKEAGNIKSLDAKIVEMQPMITLIAPVYKNNKLARIVLFSSEIQDIANNFFRDLKSGTRGYAWMMDKDGNLLYHPTQPEMVGRNLYKADATCFKCHISFDLEKRIVEGKADKYGRYIAASGEDKIIAFSPPISAEAFHG